MANQNNVKDYRTGLKELDWCMPQNAADYRENEPDIPDPDEVCVEEYKDFERLINSSERGHEGILFHGCDLILKTPDDAIRVAGDHLVHAWIRYLNPDRCASARTGWSFVENRVSKLPLNLFEKFLRCMWSPGNFIFWKLGRCTYSSQASCKNELRCMKARGRPCQTINQAKGHAPLLDRPDYTFECIRRWFENIALPPDANKLSVPEGLNNVLDRSGNKLSDLFGSWEGFVKYFRLEGSFVTEGGLVIDLSETNPPNDTKTNWSMKDIMTFTKDSDFSRRRPGEQTSDEIIEDKLDKEYETYLRNSICAITNRNEALGDILNG